MIMKNAKSRFAVVALSLLLPFFVTHTGAGELQSANLDVKGMTCSTCPLTVKVALKKQPGVSEVSVDYKAQSASVKFNPEKIKAEQLAAAVTEAGFPTTVKK